MSEVALPQVSVIIRCCNEEQHIGRLLTGIMQQTVGDLEVIVVDSGSTDATLSIASRYPVRILSIRPESFSFGRSLNLGCEAARSEFIVIASAHVYPVYNDWLEQLLVRFSDSKVGLVYGKQRGGGSTHYSEQQIFRSWFPDQSVSRQNNPFCNNANAAIRRELWEKVPYNEELSGLEDIEWARRAMEKGYYIAYAAQAEITHVHNEKPLNIYDRYRREGMAHKQIFTDQKFSLWDLMRTFTANVTSDYYHAWHDRMLANSLLSIPLFRLMQFWGTYRGFLQPGLVTAELKKRFYYPNSLMHVKVDSRDNRENQRIDYGQFPAKEFHIEDH